MFEAARHGGGGHWERVGRGGDWRGWQAAEDRGELGKVFFHCSCDRLCCPPPVCSCWNPAVGHRAGMPSGSSFKHSSPPSPPTDGFHGEVKQDFPCRPRPKVRRRSGEVASLPPPQKYSQ